MPIAPFARSCSLHTSCTCPPQAHQQQKRKLTRLQDRLSRLVSRYSKTDLQHKQENLDLSDEYCSITEQFQDLQSKSHHFQALSSVCRLGLGPRYLRCFTIFSTKKPIFMRKCCAICTWFLWLWFLWLCENLRFGARASGDKIWDVRLKHSAGLQGSSLQWVSSCLCCSRYVQACSHNTILEHCT